MLIDGTRTFETEIRAHPRVSWIKRSLSLMDVRSVDPGEVYFDENLVCFG